MRCKILSVLILCSLAFSALAQVSVSIPNMEVQRGETVEVSFKVTGLSPSDSLIAYQLVVVYNPAVIQGVGASKEGTMTANWDNPVVAIKYGKTQSPRDTLRVVGITTNQPGKRVVQDDGILVKLKFLVTGNVGETVSICIQAIRLFRNTGEISISTKTDGVLTVIENSSNVTVMLDLSPNWNLVSFPVMPVHNTLPKVLGEDTTVVRFIYAYISGVGPKTWDKNRPSFLNDLTSLDGLHGYWMKLNSSTSETLALSGNPVAVTTPIFLHKGWNLISYLPNSSDSLWHAFQTLGKAYRIVSAYSPKEGGTKTWDRNRPPFLNDLKQLKPTFGYWVKMDTAKFLVYPSAGYLPKRMAYFSETLSEKVQSSPFWCDFWAFQPELLVPGDTLLVYDSDGVLCGDTLVSPQGAFLVHVIGDDPSSLDEDEGAIEGDTLTFVIGGKVFFVYGTSQNFDSTIVPGPAIWTNMGSKRVQFNPESNTVERHTISTRPEKMLLFQNYPNPFNQNTVIHYSLPESDEKAQLKIFDTQGREMRVWSLSRERQNGQVIWDGRDKEGKEVPSGIYLYHIKTKQGVVTRKCVLLK